ncbi:hypothetical protein niasHT_000063 [Heterodera trifolii]|uniref:Protein kinase domain-containing protein n=1 Tax=Heterodera trifolii TaxID=157864 RepID=A0ABD2MCQ9_9BILA
MSYKNSKQSRVVKTSGNDDFSGSFGEISVGYVVNAEKQKQCVAVKFFKKEEDKKEGDEDGNLKLHSKAIKVAKLIKKCLDEKKRRHLIEMIDAGSVTDGTDKLIIIMELGTETFADRMYDRKVRNESDKDWLKIIAKLAIPLEEFHNVAIHMDVKASNYLYVPKNGKELLKLIDYDGAQLIDSRNKNGTIFVDDAVFTEQYCAPEFEGDNHLISRKFDIWSLGMIIHEAFVDKLRQEKGKETLELEDRERFMTEMRNLYDYDSFSKSYIKKMLNKSSNIASIDQFDDKTWGKNNNLVEIVLEFWQRYPKTALLVTNMLHPTWQQRLTAKGILDFVAGKCYLRELKWAKKAKKLRLFNYFKFGELKQMIMQKQRMIRIQLWKKNRKEMQEKFGNLKRKVAQIMEQQQKEIDEISMITNCENE